MCLWRRRYESARGPQEPGRSGRPRRINRRRELAVVTATMRAPKHAAHWSARRLAKEVGLRFMTGQRSWQKYGLHPHRVETFKFSSDPEFDAKLSDIVGLYLDPPRGRWCVRDEKSQIQALTAPSRRCRGARPEMDPEI